MSDFELTAIRLPKKIKNWLRKRANHRAEKSSLSAEARRILTAAYRDYRKKHYSRHLEK